MSIYPYTFASKTLNKFTTTEDQISSDLVNGFELSNRRELKLIKLLINQGNLNSLMVAKPKSTDNNRLTIDSEQSSRIVLDVQTLPSSNRNNNFLSAQDSVVNKNQQILISSKSVLPFTDLSDKTDKQSNLNFSFRSPFTKLYVFGDSLSDQGNIFNTTSFANRLVPEIPIIPNSPYFNGRFSNGPIWIDYLSAGLGLPTKLSSQLSVLSPALPIASPITLINGELRASPFFNGATTSQGVNFAFGGAQTGFNSGSSGTVLSLIPGVLQQVSWFINDHASVGKTADSNALYVVLAGGNDYLDPNNALQPNQSVTNIALSIAGLYSQGARNFLIPNLPDLGILPRALKGGIESEKRLTNLTIAHNSLLSEAVTGLANLLPQSNFIPLNFFGLLNNIAANPSQLGITNITDPSFNSATGAIVGDPNTRLFWDEIHPTALGHFGLGITALASVLNLTPQVNNLTASEQILPSIGSQFNLDQSRLFPDTLTPISNETATMTGISSNF